MTGELDTRWAELERSATTLLTSAKHLNTMAPKVVSAIQEGNLAVAERSLGELVEQLNAAAIAGQGALETAARIKDQLSHHGALAKEVEEKLRSVLSDRRIWTGFDEVVVHPVRITFKRSETPGSIKVSVDKQSMLCQRPSVVADSAMKALRAEAKPERFAKSLHQAFKASNNGAETGRAPLTSLYGVLAATPPEVAGYSIRDFTIDVQYLYASRLARVGRDISFRFDVVGAGLQSVTVFEASGGTINLGSVTFEHADSANG